MAKIIQVHINILNQLFEILMASESSELQVDSSRNSFSMFFFEWCLFFATLLEIPQLQHHLKIGTCPSQRFNKSNSIIVGIIVSIIVNSRVLRSCSRFRRWGH